MTTSARARVALETTLLLHGVPRPSARDLAHRLATVVRAQGAEPALVGVLSGRPIVGLNDQQLDALLNAARVQKVNTANLGVIMSRAEHGATTVSTTMELAAGAGVSVFATGGIGGVHRPPAQNDISADLIALTRFPVAVVCSGCKSILDIAATRELLETLGVPVIGYQTDAFPAFYLREAPDPGVGPVDARFDEPSEMARFVRRELARTNRGVLICNPIPVEHELHLADWRRWLSQAEQSPRVQQAGARDATPALLGMLHELSGGATLAANIELVVSNATLAAQLAAAIAQHSGNGPGGS